MAINDTMPRHSVHRSPYDGSSLRWFLCLNHTMPCIFKAHLNPNKEDSGFDSRTKALYTATGRTGHNNDGIDDDSVQKDSGLPGRVE
jgi:hypothetical protein